MGRDPGGPGGAEAFAEVARSLLAQQDVQHTLQKIVDLAVETIHGCDHAGITVLRGGMLRRASQRLNVKIRDLADDLASGARDVRPPSAPAPGHDGGHGDA